MSHESPVIRRTFLRRLAACLATVAALLVLPAAPAVARSRAAQEEVSHYTIEALAVETESEARREAEALLVRLKGEVEVGVGYDAPYHTVQVGRFDGPEEGEGLLARVRELGFEDAWVVAVPRSSRPTIVSAPDPEPRAPVTTNGKRALAMRIERESPRLDGRLDDAAWQSAEFSSDFQQKGAKRGFPPHERTEVAFLYDDQALYVGARVHLRDPRSIRAPKSQRDQIANADRLIVSLDTLRNRQTAYNFGVTAAGTRIDYYQPDDIFEVRDFTFDPVWDARTSIDSGGWSAEMRIPFSSLRFHRSRDAQTWGVNVQRVSPAMRLYAFWVVVPGEETGWSSRFGELVGLEGVQPAARLAVVPYAAGQSLRVDDEIAAADPLAGDDEVDWRFGGDLLADITPSLSLEATINPDYGQIEADPAVVNLSAYEVFFPEKRPFFLEGAQLLQGPGPRYYYSRRVGAPPPGVRDAFPSSPSFSTISGAAKLIGRLPSGLSIGALAAVVDDEATRIFDPSTGDFETVAVQPQSLFGVTRLQKDLGAGSTFGFVGTAVSRDLASGSPLAGILAERAFAGGVDWNLRFANQSHEFGGFLGGSIVEGDAAALLRLQGSSARYYQRPDADYVELDPARTELSGYTAGMRVGRIEGAWRWTVGGEVRSPGFELNDAGAMATADDRDVFGQVSYGKPMRRGLFQRIDVAGSLAGGWNFGNVRQYTTPAIDLNLVWRNFWQTYLHLAYDTRALSDSLTRGGPLMGTGTGWRSRFGVRTNDANRHVWSLDGTSAADELDGWSYSVRTRLGMQLTEHFSFSVIPGYERVNNTRQFFSRVPNGRPETFDQRYVFATLDQSTVYTRLRVGLAITPNLGLDLYVEPFVSAGSFDAFGELLAAESRDLRLYGTDGTTITRLADGSYEVTDGASAFTLGNGDFDITSLRGNAVLRWDFAQGSTLYFVWAQNRAVEDARGERVGPDDLFNAFDAPTEDIFAIKASYRFDFK